MKRILIATDGSPASREAVVRGLDLAVEHDSEVLLVHVMPAIDLIPWSGFGMTGAVPHAASDRDRAPLDEALETAEKRGIIASTELLTGDPVDEIVAFADSRSVDLIVIGSRGHGTFASSMLGSVSLGVLRETRRPVLVVRAARTLAAVPV